MLNFSGKRTYLLCSVLLSCLLCLSGVLSTSVSAVEFEDDKRADLFQIQRGDGNATNYGFNLYDTIEFDVPAGGYITRICNHYPTAYSSDRYYVEQWSYNIKPSASGLSISGITGSSLNVVDDVIVATYSESGWVNYSITVVGRTISNQQTCYGQEMVGVANSTHFIDVTRPRIVTYRGVPSVSDIVAQLNLANSSLSGIASTNSQIITEIQNTKGSVDQIKTEVIDQGTTLDSILQYLQNHGGDSADAINNINDETHDTFDDAQDTADADSSSSSQQATSSGTTLLSGFQAFLGALTGASPSNCVINADMGNMNLGSIDLCQLDPPPAFQAISSIMVIGFTVPLSLALGKKMIALFRSFQT